MDLIDARAYHLAELRRLRGHAPNHSTQRLYGAYMRRHLEYLDLHHLEPRLELLNQHTVAGCQLWIREQHAPGARDGRSAELSYVRIMRIWSRFLFRRHIIPADLLAGMELPRLPKITRRAFTADEARALLGAISVGKDPVRDRAMVAVLADTGCRVGELCGLELQDVLTPDGALRGSIYFRRTKGGSPRDVAIAGERIRSALCAWLAIRNGRGSALFTNSRGDAIQPRHVRWLHTTWGRQAHVSPCHPHLWRHTSATEALAEGVPENSIRDRLGHVSPNVLADYLHQSDRTRVSAAERASLFTKWEL